MYKFARLPDDKKLISQINLGASTLFDSIDKLDSDSLNISDYNKRYLKRYKNKLRTHLQRLSYLLAWSIFRCKKPLSEITIIDYGGGAGLLSLLAKACGIGSVIYNDIYDVSCIDARVVGESTNFQADYYVTGDIDALKVYLKNNAIIPDALVSCDVMEHIYDLKTFLKSLHSLSENNLNYVISTHANPLNPIIRRTLMKQQIIAETQNKVADYGHKSRDSLKSFLDVRKEIIVEKYSDQLSESDINQLAINTRGKQRSDIDICLEEYIETKRMPAPLSHPTNTCDPHTGNWADRLTDPFEIRNLFLEAGLNASVLSCYHGDPKNIFKNILANVLDILINIFGKHGLRLASYFMLYGNKK